MKEIMNKYKIFIRDEYSRDEIVPWWKGFVSHQFYKNSVKVAPLGFNIIFTAIYNLWIFLKTIGCDLNRFRQDQLSLRSKKDDTY